MATPAVPPSMQTAPSRRPCSRLGPAEAAVSGLPLPQSGALWPLRKARFRAGPVPLRRGSEAASDDASRLDFPEGRSYDGRDPMAATAADLVGRERELAAIAEFLEVDAAASAVVVEGEPGIGKTTVWEAAVAAASERGFQVLRARPGDTEAKLAFSGLTDLLGEALPSVLGELSEPQRRALRIALLLEEDRGTRLDRRAVAAGLLSALRALSSETPVVVAIDDAQWLDRSSAAALDYATRRMGELPVALLIARRLDRAPGFDLSLPPSRLLRVPVGPLDFVALNALLHARLGTVLPRPLLHRIHELSGGNPFFALELARDPARVDPGHGLPPTLDVLVRDRVSALPEAAQTALLVAAAASHPTAELVDRVTGTRDALAAAEEAHIVVLDHEAVRFEHPLLASAAYGAATPARRRDVHRELARRGRDPEERARHLAAAAMGPDEKIALALEKGAAAARARGAPAAAAELSEQAARLTPTEDPGAARRRRADAGYFHFESGDSRKALTLLEEVVGELPPGAERAEGLIRLARVRSYSDDLEAATNLFLQAAEEAGEDGLTRARAHQEAASAGRILAQPRWTAAIARMWWDEPAAVRETYEELAEQGRELGDEGSLAYVYLMLAQADLLLAEFDRAEADAAAARDIAEQGGQETLVAYALGLRAMADTHRGRDAGRLAEQALELGRRTQGTPAVHLATSALGLLELSSGRAEEAAAALGPLVDYARDEEIREPGLTRFVIDQVEALIELSRLDEAEDLLGWFAESAERLRRARAPPTPLGCRGPLAAASGRVEGALGTLQRALAAHDAAALPFDRARTLLALGATLRRAKRKADARRALEEAVAAFDALGAETFAARARSELERIGGRAPL